MLERHVSRRNRCGFAELSNSDIAERVASGILAGHIHAVIVQRSGPVCVNHVPNGAEEIEGGQVFVRVATR